MKPRRGGIFSFLNPWHKRDLAPGLQIKVRKGLRVVVKNTGTEDAPAWLITPRKKVLDRVVAKAAATTTAGVGGLPLIPLIGKGLVTAIPAIGKGIERRRALKSNPWKSTIAPGKRIVLEGVDVGALLIDSDGLRTHV